MPAKKKCGDSCVCAECAKKKREKAKRKRTKSTVIRRKKGLGQSFMPMIPTYAPEYSSAYIDAEIRRNLLKNQYRPTIDNVKPDTISIETQTDKPRFLNESIKKTTSFETQTDSPSYFDAFTETSHPVLSTTETSQLFIPGIPKTSTLKIPKKSKSIPESQPTIPELFSRQSNIENIPYATETEVKAKKLTEKEELRVELQRITGKKNSHLSEARLRNELNRLKDEYQLQPNVSIILSNTKKGKK